MSVIVAIPATEESAIVYGLRELTRLLDECDPEDVCGGLLGGSDGYGHEHTCDIFEMHQQWWGDCTDGCPWDNAAEEVLHVPVCKAGRPNFRHDASGLEVRWYKWIGRSMEFSREVSPEEWAGIMADCRKAVQS